MTDSPSASPDRDQPLGSYVVITPVRDEEEYVEETIRSMLKQTIPPVNWILVDDGSRDRTPEILQRYVGSTPWLDVVTREDRGFRATGSGEVDAFYEGYSNLRTDEWDFIVKLDADLVFDEDYFERCLRHFAQEPRLGIAGGTIESVGKNGIYRESHPSFHVRGATKIYRRTAWEALTGIVAAPGWDTLDEVRANILDWKTRTFPEIVLRQLRPTGSALGQWRSWLKDGEGCYLVGYHPLFLLARSVFRLSRRPYVVAAAGLLTGYVWALVRRVPRTASVDTMCYLRRQQMARLLGRDTIWR